VTTTSVAVGVAVTVRAGVKLASGVVVVVGLLVALTVGLGATAVGVLVGVGAKGVALTVGEGVAVGVSGGTVWPRVDSCAISSELPMAYGVWRVSAVAAEEGKRRAKISSQRSVTEARFIAKRGG
jgi:hypothetical protein